MQGHPVAHATRRVQLALACAVLVIGSLIYVLCRPAESTILFGAFAVGGQLPEVVGPIANSFPTVAHAFSLSVITALWLGMTKRGRIAACLLWLGIDGVFEIGQHAAIAARIAALIPDRLDLIGAFFSTGTFDVGDLISIGIGTAAAYVITARGTRGTRIHE